MLAHTDNTTIVLILQRRVEAGAAALLIKVKAHRGDPMNEDTDIREDLGRLKEHKETIWDDSRHPEKQKL